jgi:hypothetical protein
MLESWDLLNGHIGLDRIKYGTISQKSEPSNMLNVARFPGAKAEARAVPQHGFLRVSFQAGSPSTAS